MKTKQVQNEVTHSTTPQVWKVPTVLVVHCKIFVR